MPKLGAEEVYLAGRSRGVKAKKPDPKDAVGLWVGPLPHWPPTPHREQIDLRYRYRLEVAHKREGEAAALRTRIEVHELVHGRMPG